MDLKEDFRGLLKKGYSVINELNKSTDMTPKQTVLKQNGINSQNQAKELIINLHQLVDAFDNLLQTFLFRTIDEKMKILDGHSEEVTQCVDYVSHLCLVAEDLVKEDNLQVVRSFGPETKAEFLKSLSACRELKLVDYETFTSLDLEVDFSGLFQHSMVNIVSWSPQCLKKQIVHSLGFGNLEKDVRSVYQARIYGKSPHTNKGLDHKDSASPINLLHQQTEQWHHSNGSLPATKSQHDKKHDTDKVSLLCNQKTLQFDTAESYCNVLNCHPSSCVSTQSKTNSSVAHLARSKEHVQSSQLNMFVSSNYQSQVNTKPIIIVPNDNNSMEVSETITQVLNNLKLEVTEDEEIQKIESTVKKNMHVYENFKPEQNLGSSCIQTEPASSNTDKFTSFEKEDFVIISPSGKSKTGDDQTPQIKNNSWNLSNIEPLKMTFDLRTVLSANMSRIPEIIGHHVKTIAGDRHTSFSFPIGITVTADDNVVIADTSNHIVKVMYNNMVVLTIGNNDGVNFCRPSAVVADNEGNIYVKDDICIQIFNRRGQLLQTVGESHFCHPYGLALAQINNEPVLVMIDSERKQYVLYHYYIRRNKLQSYRYDAAQEYGVSFTKIRFLGVYNNFLLVSDLGANAMYLSHLDGKPVRAFGGYGRNMGQFRDPSGITVDAVGNWIVGDSKNNRLQVFTNDGQVLATIKLLPQIRRPSGIHLTSDGHLYVINYLDSTINVYNLHQ